MILWNVKIPLRAKISIGGALCLSCGMILIAIFRIALGTLAPQVSDTVWTYFTFSIEASTAVFMVSATAFRSTFGHHRGTRAVKTDKDTPLSNISAREGATEKSVTRSNIKPLIGHPKPKNWYDKDDITTQTIYQDEIDDRTELTREVV